MTDHKDTTDADTCSCGYRWTSIWDMLNHREVVFNATLPLSPTSAIDLFDVLESIYELIENGEVESAKEALEAVAAAIYAAATGDFDEMIINAYTYDLDKELKELLDDEADNDK
jgi:hypothetical protein